MAFDPFFKIEKTGVSQDRARMMAERYAREERPCLSCGETFTATDSASDDGIYKLAIFCESCSAAGISKRSVPEVVLNNWLDSYGPNRKRARNGNKQLEQGRDSH